ncbi:3D domain-containing protein [Desulfosporosinus meridiei]|nr:3D domain-containing protein [Desulfosporosinus meridiei]
MIVTAYTANDRGRDGKGITASGEPVKEGWTIAADPSLPFGTKIYIPKLEHTYTVTDRGGAIRGNRLDLYMEKRSDAIEFGIWELEVWIEN